MGAFIASVGIMLHREEVGKRHPRCNAKQVGKRFGCAGVALIHEQVPAFGCAESGIAADFDLLIIEPNGSEVFCESFVKPALRRRIVVAQKHQGEVMRHRPPGFRFEDIQNHEILVVPAHEKSGDVDGLALPQRGSLVVSFIVC